MSEKTQIQVSRETVEKLTALGKKTDTYDDIIVGLMERDKERIKKGVKD
jgi:hypothetical protein